MTKQLINIFEPFAEFCKEQPAFLVDKLKAKFEVNPNEETLAYFEKTVIPHKIAVYEAGIELIKKLNLALCYQENWVFDFENNLIFHDFSKFSDQESFAYASQNFKEWDANSEKQKQAFDRAWLHHMNHNEHHPEYWLKRNREGKITALEIPEIYVIEMIADWIGAGKTYQTPFEEWVKGNFDKFLFHPNTKALAMQYLKKNGLKL